MLFELRIDMSMFIQYSGQLLYTGEDGQNRVHVYHVYNRVHWHTLWLHNGMHMIRYLKQSKTNED